jgi:uncharacterized membrane protein YkgB
MLARLFPARADNAAYRGWRPAVWLLAALVILRLGMGASTLIQPVHVAITADGIPLASYGPAAAQMVVALFALLGLWFLLFGLAGAAVLIRYRALIPLFYLFMLAQQLGARAVHALYPDGGGPGGASVLVIAILAATVIGLALSLADRSAARARSANAA